MQVKVCGLTQPENIQRVVDLGVDYIGLIFYDKSKRFAEDPALKKWLVANSGSFEQVKKVGVFVNAEIEYILNTVHDYELDYVQLHGNESAGYCQELALLWSVNTLRSAKIAKAFSITPGFNFGDTLPYSNACDLFIFDTGGQPLHGGTGVKWDWSKLAEYSGTTPFLLSGGIGPADSEAIEKVAHPQFLGLDLNSKFEATPGVKDPKLLEFFLRAIRS